MVGIFLVGFMGFLVVAVLMPVVLWGLCMETLRQRAVATKAPASIRLSSVPHQVVAVALPSRAAA